MQKLIVSNNNQTGSCSIWWDNTPSLIGHKLGFIGHYFVTDEQTATSLLNNACQELTLKGCTMAIAPIDGSTWQNYRLLTQRGDYPVFFLEPDNPDDWQQHFLHQGFTPIAHYTSSLNTNLRQSDSRLEKISQRFQHQVYIRSIDLQQIEKELQRIYTIVIQSFRSNFLFTPIDEAEFIAQYRPLLPYIQSELVLIAEHDNNPVGFIFAIPDYLQKKQGDINTVIIKTLAILPQRIYAGLGYLLLAQCQQIAHQLGYTQAIHALMHEKNSSRNLSRHYHTRTIRQYTLFAKELESKS